MNRTFTPPLWQVVALLVVASVTYDASRQGQEFAWLLVALYLTAVAFDVIKALASANTARGAPS